MEAPAPVVVWGGWPFHKAAGINLRHGAATMALAAGVPMKVISNRLRHSSPHFTAQFYGDVLPELSHQAAEATAPAMAHN